MSSTSSTSPTGLQTELHPTAAPSTFVICIVSVMPLRAAASDSSEMVSQLLFGEAAEVLETGAHGWVRIRNQFDRYEGWAATNQLTSISEAFYREPPDAYSSELITTALVNGAPMPLSRGSFLRKMADGRMQWNNLNIQYNGNPIYLGQATTVDKKALENCALQYINTPYLWGGRSAFGIDCSGFVQSVFRLMGITLPRDASQQAACGSLLQSDTPWQPGDLAFFSAPGKTRISHVGLLLPDSKIIHASGQVRVDPFDTKGIRRQASGLYTHDLVEIRRIIQ